MAKRIKGKIKNNRKQRRHNLVVARFVLVDIVCSDSECAKNAIGNKFTVGFLEVDERVEPRTGYTTPHRNNALQMLFIKF